MRWPFGPPHLTLKPSNKKHQQNQKKQTKKKTKKKPKKKSPPKKTAKTPKNSFSVISQFFPFFWVAFQNFPFLTSWPRKPEPKKHYKNRGFRAFFFENQLCVTKRPFLDKKTKIYKFQLSFFFAYFLLFQKQKTQKSVEIPIFIVFLLT